MFFHFNNRFIFYPDHNNSNEDAIVAFLDIILATNIDPLSDNIYLVDSKGNKYWLNKKNNAFVIESKYSILTATTEISHRLTELDSNTKNFRNTENIIPEKRELGLQFNQPEIKKIVKNPVTIQRQIPSRLQAIQRKFEEKINNLPQTSKNSEEDPLLDAPREVKKFIGQKECFSRVVHDIESGRLEEAPQFFNREYPIFKTMHDKGDLILSDNTNITQERDIFNALYNNIYGRKSEEKIEPEIFIPTSWNYMSSKQKHRIAESYGKTVDELQKIFEKTVPSELRMFSESEDEDTVDCKHREPNKNIYNPIDENMSSISSSSDAEDL